MDDRRGEEKQRRLDTIVSQLRALNVIELLVVLVLLGAWIAVDCG